MAHQTDNNAQWRKALQDEKDRIASRRKWLAKNGWGCPPPTHEVGLALSGGGIRSATFSLGLMKSMSQAELLHSVDYLSTVSGGGYAGSFYCSLFVPQSMRGPSSRAASAGECEKHAFDLQADALGSPKGRAALAQLRQGGHYLAPSGASDALFAAVIAIRNWLAMALVAGLTMLAIFMMIYLLLAIVNQDPFGIGSSLIGGNWPDASMVRPWYLILLLLSFWPLACGWAFWFARGDPVPPSRLARPFSIQLIVAMIIAAVAFVDGGSLFPGDWPDPWRPTIGVVSVGAIAAYLAAETVSFLAEGSKKTAGSQGNVRTAAVAEEDRVRSLLSGWAFSGFFALVSAAALGAICSLAKDAYEDWGAFWTPRSATEMLAAASAVATLVPIARWFLRREFGFASTGGLIDSIRRNAAKYASLLAGSALLIALLTLWAALAYAALPYEAGQKLIDSVKALAQAESIELNDILEDPHFKPLIFAGIIGVCAILLGHIDSLLNQSSLASFYGARLRRAYLGATNELRSAPHPIVDKEHPADDIQLGHYYHEHVKAPVHLINVTINETTSRSSRVIQRDRKGKPMTVCPSGFLYPKGAPGGDLSLLVRGEAEVLPISSWMGISGAAFSTGAGYHTSLGTALLAGLTNLRLGYWWYRVKRPPLGIWFQPTKWVQSYLLRELRASYEGTDANRWYLSDGGHHENTGIYELVRRRVGFIIASDNGADPHYAFGDIVNLIRKLRIDFEAEVEFLDDEELDGLFEGSSLRQVFGTLDQIRRRGGQESQAARDEKAPHPVPGPYATLARIRYYSDEDQKAQTTPSTLILIKPRITGRELPDLLQYRDTNASFPQQPTTDQFFDEAQWESYYRLGQLIGDMVFLEERFDEPARRGAWRPWDLERLPDR